MKIVNGLVQTQRAGDIEQIWVHGCVLLYSFRAYLNECRLPIVNVMIGLDILYKPGPLKHYV
jgi:hypothetical protein